MTERIPFPDHAWPLLRKALEHIAAHPDEFHMADFIVHASRPDVVDGWERMTGRAMPECGTVACLAGHIQLAAGAVPGVDLFSSFGAFEALGLGRYVDESVDPVALRLFCVFHSTETIRTYADLRTALERVFTFPEPLPEPAAVTS